MVMSKDTGMVIRHWDGHKPIARFTNLLDRCTIFLFASVPNLHIVWLEGFGDIRPTR